MRASTLERIFTDLCVQWLQALRRIGGRLRVCVRREGSSDLNNECPCTLIENDFMSFLTYIYIYLCLLSPCLKDSMERMVSFPLIVRWRDSLT